MRLRPPDVLKTPVALQQQPGNVSRPRRIALRNHLPFHRPAIVKLPHRPRAMRPNLDPGRVEQRSLRRQKHPLRRAGNILAGVNLHALPRRSEHYMLPVGSLGIALRERQSAPKNDKIRKL